MQFLFWGLKAKNIKVGTKMGIVSKYRDQKGILANN